MAFFGWFEKGKKKTRLAIFATLLSASVACSDMAKKADGKLKDDNLIALLENSESKVYKVLENAQVNDYTLKDVQKSITEMDKLNDEFGDLFYSQDINESNLRARGFNNTQIQLIKNFRYSFMNARESLRDTELEMLKKK